MYKKNSKIFLPVIVFLWFLVRLGDLGINILIFIYKTIVTAFKFLAGFNFISDKTSEQIQRYIPKPKKGRRKGVYKIFRILKFLVSPNIRRAFFAILLGALFVIYSFSLIEISHDMPNPKKLANLPTPATTEFYDRNGELLYRLYEGKDRTPVKLSDIPPDLVHATIAMEDKNFYSHFGVDMFGIARAGLSLFRDGEVQGGSTITQQLIKNTLLTPERTMQRKVKEVILALWAERIFNKDQILEMYFNEVPYGGTAWGIAAAAQTYFDKNVPDLDLAESAYLAGLPASPTTYSPYGASPELAKQRQKEVLRRMVEDKFITKAQADEAYQEELKIKTPVNEIKAPHFVMYLRSLLSEKYGERYVSQGGLKIYTTLDLSLQEKAEKIVAEEVSKLKPLNVSNGAAMITDAKTGQILAMVGNKNYWDEDSGNYNVTTALRQPGSSIKPITYATAFKQGYSPGTTLLDTPVTFRNLWETYSPVNYDGRFHGPVPIRTALGSSYNIPAVKMLAIVGLPEMLKTAHDMGITTLNETNRYGLSLTLGGGEVKMIDMMSVYGTFAQNGNKHQVKGVIKIVDSNGDLVEDNSRDPGQNVIPAGVAYLITDILSDNKARTPAFGPNSLLNIPKQTVAVKTGTTNDKRDNVTYGYTPDYVVGVWVGNMDNSPMNPALTSGVTGAAPIWNRLMAEILKDKPAVAFEKPKEIITGKVDGRTDLVLSNMSQKSIIGQNRRKVREENSDKEKEVITFTDPFSTYQSDQSGQPIIINP